MYIMVTYTIAISLPCIGGTKVPVKHAALRSHPSRPSAAPKNTTVVVMK